jgi:methylated-DNA-protein-cysteine methyltransferase-like protein
VTAPPTPFARAVHRVVASLPEGGCASYAEVAAEAGRPGAARGVGTVLSRSQGLPWWRVVRADGTLPKGEEQARRLRAEGVSIIDGRVQMAGR